MFRLDKREGWSNGAGIMHKISVLACLYLCLCVFTYFCIVQAGLGVEGRGGGSEQRCMYDGYF